MREEIIRSVAKIISSEGLEAATTRAICHSVGITAPTLYYYFKSKNILLDAVATFTYDLHRDHKMKVRTIDPLMNLRIYWDFFIDFSLEESELHRAMIVALSQGRLLKSGTACFFDLVLEFETLEKEGKTILSAKACAQIFLSAAMGLSMTCISQPKSNYILSLSKTTREITLSGLVNAEAFKKVTIKNMENYV